MLYLKNRTDAQMLMIPKYMTASGENLSLLLKSTIDKVSLSLDVTDEGSSALYYMVSVTLPNGVQTGEYEYTLMEDGVTKSNGLLMVGDSADIVEYSKTITYEQYTRE